MATFFVSWELTQFVLTSASPVPGGDLHYHLSQHGVFSEKEMRFYATEIILGLEHMHSRFVVYRDLKVKHSVSQTCTVGIVALGLQTVSYLSWDLPFPSSQPW